MLEGERAFLLISLNLEQSGDVILPATTNAVGFVDEVLAIAQRLPRVLVDGHRDDLDVLVAVPSRAAISCTFARALTQGVLSACSSVLCLRVIRLLFHVADWLRFRAHDDIPR
jgi:hypothetical protein